MSGSWPRRKPNRRSRVHVSPTSEFWNDYHHMQAHGVQFTKEPRQEPYGNVVVFLDIYGNKWDLVQHDDA